MRHRIALGALVLLAIAVVARAHPPGSTTVGDAQTAVEYDSNVDRRAVNLKLLTGTFTPAPAGRCYIKAQTGATPIIVQSCNGSDWVIVGSGEGGGGCTCPTDTPDPTHTATGTVTATATHTASATPSRTATPTATFTATATGTVTPTGGGGGSGIQTINLEDGPAISIFLDQDGSAPAITTTTDVLHVSIPEAATDAEGVVTITDQNFAGYKSFTEGLQADTLFDIASGATSAYAPAPQVIAAVSDTIDTTTTLVRLAPDADYTLTSTPTLEAGDRAGQFIAIRVHPTNAFCVTLQDDSELAGSDLVFQGGGTRTLCAGQESTFRWEPPTAKWYEIATPASLLDVVDFSDIPVTFFGDDTFTTLKEGATMQFSTPAAGTVQIDVSDTYDAPSLQEPEMNTRGMCSGANGCVLVDGATIALDGGTLTNGISGPVHSLRNTVFYDCDYVGLTNDTTTYYCPFSGGVATATIADGTTKAPMDCDLDLAVFTILDDSPPPTPKARSAMPTTCQLKIGWSINGVDGAQECSVAASSAETAGAGCSPTSTWDSGTEAVGLWLKSAGAGCPGPTPGTGRRTVRVGQTCN